jgi:signal transduction histidine kinase
MNAGRSEKKIPKKKNGKRRESSRKRVPAIDELSNASGTDLAEAYERYFGLYEGAPVPYLLIERNGCIREANEAALLLFGPAERPPVQRLLFTLTADSSRQTLYEHLRKVFATQSIQTAEINLASGREITVFLASRQVPAKSPSTEPVCGMVLFDITGFRERATAAENDRVLAWSIIYTLAEPLLILDKNLIIAYANPVFYSFFQTSPDLTEGKSLFEIQEGRWSVPGLRELLNRVIAERLRFDRFDLEYPSAAIGGKSLVISGCRMDQEGGGQPRILLMVHDVTGRRQQAALEERARELDSFNFSVSHDLRTPLQIIESFTYLLQEEEYRRKLGKEGTWIVQTIQESGRKMISIVEGLLHLSRLSRLQPGHTEIDMTSMLREVFAEATLLLKDREISLRLEMDPLPPAIGDPVLIRQVLVNLIGNAVKFTGTKAQAEVEVGGRVEGNEVVYFVRDNGIGFGPKDGQKLFAVFQRLTSHRQFEGTGIGLVVVKTIIEKHGSRVYAEAEPDRGATFYFTLPRLQG